MPSPYCETNRGMLYGTDHVSATRSGCGSQNSDRLSPIPNTWREPVARSGGPAYPIRPIQLSGTVSYRAASKQLPPRKEGHGVMERMGESDAIPAS